MRTGPDRPVIVRAKWKLEVYSVIAVAVFTPKQKQTRALISLIAFITTASPSGLYPRREVTSRQRRTMVHRLFQQASTWDPAPDSLT